MRSRACASSNAKRAALDAQAGVHRALGRDLVGRALAQEPPFPRVGALGVLAHHEHVDAVVEPARSRDERAQVDVEVELEAQRQQETPLDHPGRDVGGADRAEHHRIEGADGVEVLVLQDHAVPQVAGAAEVEGHRVVRDAGGVDALHGLGHDFGADAVPADDPDLVAHVTSSRVSVPGNEKPPTEVDGRLRTPGCRRSLRNDDDGAGSGARHEPVIVPAQGPGLHRVPERLRRR